MRIRSGRDGTPMIICVQGMNKVSHSYRLQKFALQEKIYQIYSSSSPIFSKYDVYAK